MCAVSMTMDLYTEKWQQWQSKPEPYHPFNPFNPFQVEATKEELDEFQKSVERAKQYDVEHNQSQCELEEKKVRLLKLAEELGVTITIP